MDIAEGVGLLRRLQVVLKYNCTALVRELCVGRDRLLKSFKVCSFLFVYLHLTS